MGWGARRLAIGRGERGETHRRAREGPRRCIDGRDGKAEIGGRRRRGASHVLLVYRMMDAIGDASGET